MQIIFCALKWEQSSGIVKWPDGEDLLYDGVGGMRIRIEDIQNTVDKGMKDELNLHVLYSRYKLVVHCLI